MTTTGRPRPPGAGPPPTTRARPTSAAPPNSATRSRNGGAAPAEGATRGRKGGVAPRSEAARAYRRRGLRRLAVLVACILGAIGLAYLLLLSSVFGVRSVDVVGTGLVPADAVRAAAAVTAGTPLLRLDTGAVADRVSGLRPVAAVEVQRSWPSTVTIRITERTPLAYGRETDGTRLVDAQGLDFATVAEPPPGLPELRTGSGEATVAAASVLVTLSGPGQEGLWAELLAVRADGPNDVQLVLRGDRTVRWGSAERSDRKAQVLAALLTQPGSVYDVVSPDLPTIR